MVRSAIDRGVTYVDTAFGYHSPGTRDVPGESEPFLAYALKDGYREKARQATKLLTWLVGTRADMDRFLDLQLKRLDVRQIDCYLAHDMNAKVWEPLKRLGILGFFEEAAKDGRIRFPSFSFHDEFPLFEEILESFDWSLALAQYNCLDREYQAGSAGVSLAHGRGTAVAVMEPLPLRGGFLVRHLPEEAKEAFRKIRPDWPLSARAFNWLWSRPGVSMVVSGMSGMPQVDMNVRTAQAYRDGIFGPEEERAVDWAAAFFSDRIQVGCTSCCYCMPCGEGVDIPRNLGLYNQYHLFDADEARDMSRFTYTSQVQHPASASRCVACDECLEKCPQHIDIDIPEYLKKAALIFNAA